jgi:molybdenum cofactor cytidylyltransferase
MPDRPPPVVAVVLAAGHSRRMGTPNKLLLPVRGEAMVRHAVHAARAAGCAEVIVVLGHEAAAVRAALDGLVVRCVVNDAHADGLGSSVRCGDAAAAPDAALLCLLGDMPDVQAGTLRALITALAETPGTQACRPVHGGQPGNPVLWAPAQRPRLATLQGDEGARALLKTLGGGLLHVPVDDPGVLLDLDTPQDLRRHGDAA